MGAVALVALGLVPVADAAQAVGKGFDVYLFLIGMMLLSEVARQERLFDRLAVSAARFAKGSALRLFGLVYAVGILVTVFLSNDATAVVLTPAVYAAARAAKAEPLPYLFVCAFIANAASFVLPISNPANLVVFASHPPALLDWLILFGPASLVAIVVTFLALWLVFWRDLRREVHSDVVQQPLGASGWIAAGGIAEATLVLLTASALDAPLGLPTLLAGMGTAVLVLVVERKGPLALIKEVSWSVLPLVAGLFIIVAGLERTGAVEAFAGPLAALARSNGEGWAAVAAGAVVALASNLMNNLPAGLIASAVVAQAHATQMVAGGVLIGIDLGPNLSVTGSLATILWLLALRREGEHVGAWRFLRIGFVVMTPALVGALGALVLFGR